ncbi:MAG: hypothetical protein ACRDAQ_04100 [Cetobacterium sp.]
MKVNINTNHIRICKLLGYLQNENIDFVAKFLNMDKQNVNLYIKQIYSFINLGSSKKNLNKMIGFISKNTNTIAILKTHQCFTKENRIFYIILLLLRDGSINLNNLSNILSVSRRALSNDILIVKEHLEVYNLEINSENAKGISLIGVESDMKLASLSYLYKVLIEFDDLPSLITEDFTDFLNKNFILNLDKDIDQFISEFEFDFFPQNKHLLKSFIIIYGNLSQVNEPTISSLNFKNFEEIFKTVIPASNLNSFYTFIKKSFFGNILIQNIELFIDTLKFCNGILESENKAKVIDLKYTKDLIFKNLSLFVTKDSFLERFLNKVNLSNLKGSTLSICDLEFLNFNLVEKDRIKCTQLFFALRKIYSGIQLSNIIIFYIWTSHDESLNNVKNTLVVFDNIPTFLFPIIKDKFLLKENMDIMKFVKASELDEHLSNKDISCIITFEKLKIHSKYPFIKSYTLPTL